MLDIALVPHGGGVVVVLAGRVDTDTAAALESRLSEVIEGGEAKLVIDLADVDYLNSVGIRVFLKASKQAQARDGRIVLCGVRPALRQVFELSGFAPVLALAETRDLAVAALDR